MMDSIEEINFHGTVYKAPFADLLPRLKEDELAQLRADIEARGVLVSVVIDEQNNIIDGYHRLMLATELGKSAEAVSFDIRPGLNDEEKKALADDLNLHRRHLDREERRKLIEARLIEAPERSNRDIAQSIGVSHPTVASVRNELETTGKIYQLDSRIGKDGKQRPTTRGRGKSILALNKKQSDAAIEALKGLDIDVLPDKTMTTRRMQRIARENAPIEEEYVEPVVTSGMELYFGDFRSVLAGVADHSVDLIFTDPPYGETYLSLWSDLGKFANRVLKPGRLLVAYSGQYHLVEVIRMLCEHLSYIWLGGLKMRGPHKNIVQQRRIYNRCKPLLFFVAGDYEPVEWIDDFFDDDRQEKDRFEWQQGVAPARYYIEKLTDPGQVVIDPFLGSGTTGEVAVVLDRTFIGAEINERMFSVAKRRIGEAGK